VVDDEESIRMLLEEGLSTHGLEVDCAANAEAALALVLGRSYDILLCDLNLSIAGGGKVSGRDVANNILEASGPEKPSVIFMTGDLVAPEHSGSGTGEPRLLQKPFRISDVLATIQEVCALKQLETPSSKA
jgi:DNA-binding response OmpR family regulator